MRVVRVTLVGVLCLVVSVGIAPVAGAQYPPASDAECVRTLDLRRVPTTVFSPGEEIIVEGRAIGNRQCFRPGSRITIQYSCDTNLGTATANAQGNYSTRVRIPSGASPGAATICARSGDIVYTRSITVRGVAAAGARFALPKTGGELAALAGFGGGMLFLGLFLIALTWRHWRRARHERSLQRAGLGGPLPLSDEDWLHAWNQGTRPGAELEPAGVTAPPAERNVTEADILGL